MVTDATFEQEVLKSDIPVLVDFWAPWCGPCRMIAPLIDQLAEEYQGKLKAVRFHSTRTHGGGRAIGDTRARDSTGPWITLTETDETTRFGNLGEAQYGRVS